MASSQRRGESKLSTEWQEGTQPWREGMPEAWKRNGYSPPQRPDEADIKIAYVQGYRAGAEAMRKNLQGAECQKN